MQRVAVACHRPLRGPGVAVGVCARLSLVLVVALMTRSVDICIARLRRKIEIDPHRPRFIRTAHGDGYVLTTSTESN